jgi:hypothetical protein
MPGGVPLSRRKLAQPGEAVWKPASGALAPLFHLLYSSLSRIISFASCVRLARMFAHSMPVRFALLLLALASNTHAFQPVALRGYSPESKAVAFSRKTITIPLRTRTQNSRFSQALRAAAVDVCPEEMYELAQASY